ncbi:MAG: pyridoxal-dependent decarboxylase [Gemmatimonadota bacterium]|nr:pyridoxal-dependent decarboxylase [Gemmatimonadota bacterium]
MASPLPDLARDWTGVELREALDAASEWAVRYRARVAELPVFPSVVPGETQARLPPCPPREPEDLDVVLGDLDEIIVPGLTHWNHPGFFAYFASSARGPSVVAELLIAAVGVNAMLWRTSPAATELEGVVVDWLRQAVGLPEGFRGMILDTASTSSFTAVLAARERADPDAREDGVDPRRRSLAVYVSDQAHSSVEKSVIAAGLGRSSVRKVPSDEVFRMDPAALEAAIERDLAGGVTPALVTATLGTTSTASVDPIGRIAEVAGRHGVWLHVDAAYAGPAAMLAEERPAFDGWESADSIVINPHKWLGTSLDCSVLLFRDASPFRSALSLNPAYLESEHPGVTNLNELGLPLGRRFRALKLWLLFRCVGTAAIEATLRTHIGWARWLAEALEADPRFELAAPVGFGTVCFRAVAAAGGAEEEALNRAVLARVNASGEAFISHTELSGRYTLRLSIGSVHTRAGDVETALRRLEEAVDAELEESGRSA